MLPERRLQKLSRCCLETAFLLLCSYTALVQRAHGYQKGPLFDPCANLTKVTKGDSFTVGLLFLPGQNASAVTEYMNNQKTIYGLLNLPFAGICEPNITTFLATSLLARFAVFSARVDRLQLLQIPYSDIVIPMSSLDNINFPATMTMLAFRAGIYSDAVYVASANTSLSTGYGFAITLSLMATFDTGTLTYMHWWGTNCDACGGVNSPLCLDQPVDANVRTCTTPLDNCTCAGVGIPAYGCNYNSDLFTQCNTGVQLAWLGTDQKDTAFTTGAQVQSLNSYSIVSLYYTVTNFLMETLNSTTAGITASWNTVQAESKEQRVDQQTSFGRRRTLFERLRYSLVGR